MNNVSNGIINNNKYFFLNLIFVFLNIIATKNNATGKKHVPIYIKFSKIIGSTFPNVVKTNCKITPILIIKTVPKTDANACCN